MAAWCEDTDLRSESLLSVSSFDLCGIGGVTLTNHLLLALQSIRSYIGIHDNLLILRQVEGQAMKDELLLMLLSIIAI